jgi:hypothetical protein
MSHSDNHALRAGGRPRFESSLTRPRARFDLALRVALTSALAFAFGSAPTRVSAAGFDVSRIGGERGHATTPTPFATYYNPAALANTRKIHIAGDLTLVFHSASYNRTETSVPVPPDAPDSNTGTSNLFDTLVAPSLAGSMKFGNFAVGLSVLAPMSGSQSWGGNSAYKNNTMYPGVRDGTARWQMFQGEQLVLYTTLRRRRESHLPESAPVARSNRPRQRQPRARGAHQHGPVGCVRQFLPGNPVGAPGE